MKLLTTLILLSSAGAAVHAQAVAPSEFPADTAAPAADELRTRIAGKVFRVARADGNGWRLDYRANGYYFVNTDTGYTDKGTWRVEPGKLCTESPKSTPSCNEVRVRGEEIFLKRSSNGEVIALKPS